MSDLSHRSVSNLQKVAELKEALAKKQAEVKATTQELTKASERLSKKVEAISAFRKASNDLREKIAANEAKRKVRSIPV